jgi:Predicted Fe-S-cluster redox enzyme
MTMLEHVAKEQKPLIGKSMEDLEAFSQSLGQELFRGRQLFDWIYRKNVYNFSEMSDLPNSFREKLSGIPLHPLRMVNDHVSNSNKHKSFYLN